MVHGSSVVVIQITKPIVEGNMKVIFRAIKSNGDAEAPITILCFPDDKVSLIIERYRGLSLDYDNKKKFIFNAKNLSLLLTVAEAGITDGANIFVVPTK